MNVKNFFSSLRFAITKPIDRDNRQSTIRRVTWIGAFIDAVLAAVKIVIGWLVHSPALVADGFHSLSDLITDFAVVFFAHIGEAEPDEDHPYGHHRYETLGTVILGTTLIVIGTAIAWDTLLVAFDNNRAPQASIWAIFIAITSVVSKEWIFRFTLKAAKVINSKLLEANAWHSRSDAFSSVVVLVGVVATWLGFAWVELFAAFFVAVLIGKMGVTLTWNASQELIDRGIEPEESQKIEKTIMETPGVEAVHMLRSRKMGNHIYLDVHVQVASWLSVSEGHFISEAVMANIEDAHDDVTDITVHVDYEDDIFDVEEHNQMPSRKEIEKALAELDIQPSRLLIHYVNQSVQLELFFKEPPEDWSGVQQRLCDWQSKQDKLTRCDVYCSQFKCG